MFKKSLVVSGALMILFAITLAACSATPPATDVSATTVPTIAETATASESPAAVADVPFIADWQSSGHADVNSEPFKHWNGDDPAVVPAACARCHTPAGFVEFAGTGKVAKDIPAPAGVINCSSCHSPEARALTKVTFPSGKEIDNLGPEARCMTCHQGRESKVSVDKKIADFNITDVDAIVAPMKDASGKTVNFGFINIHYFAAGATLYGSQAQAGYEYEGAIYDPKFRHVDGVDTCIACHNQHTLKIRVEKCQECHENVKTVDDLKDNRMNGSLEDYNGNGDTKEGIYYEMKGLQDTLYSAIQAYAVDVIKTPIAYDGAAYPYFFVADADGKPVQKDGKPVTYTTWSARLLKAAYNYQLSVKDPGAFAHNAKYVMELLHDSTADLNTKLAKPIDMSKMARNDAAHFAGDTEPFRHWDSENFTVPFACAKCHSAQGLPTFIKNGGSVVVDGKGSTITTGIGAQPSANGFMCATCHDPANFPKRYVVNSTTFPSGKTVSLGGQDADGKFLPDDANLCITCHQGRESTLSVNNALKGKDVDTPDKTISFKNIHYLGAGATLFGNDAQGAYQYEGKEYLGQNMHPGDGSLAKCTVCHDVHKLEPKLEICAGCHVGKKLEEIRGPLDKTDYDGDGNTTEGMKGEVDTLAQALYAEIQKYAEAKSKLPIVYNVASYPYFFVDADKDGKGDKNDKGAGIGYNAYTPRLLRAAYNYQYVQKDPGAFVHNPRYVIQFLIDSIADLGGDVSKYTRPAIQ
jgi:hypothetical protein